MSVAEAAPLTEVEMQQATTNYIRCLNLKPSSQILVVTDELPIDSPIPIDANMRARTTLAQLVFNQVTPDHRKTMLRLRPGMEKDEMKTLMTQTLSELDALSKTPEDSGETIVVYLGAQWANRGELYDALSEFGEDRTVRLAGSLGLTTGDCRVMSNIGPRELLAINNARSYFERFFRENPRGSLQYTTTAPDGEALNLTLSYDTNISNFKADLSQIGEGFDIEMQDYTWRYGNIPGGEYFIAPFPYKNTNGSFAAHGIVFSVIDGCIVGADTSKATGVLNLDPRTQTLIGMVQNGGSMPLSEIGLGLYELADIKTYPDSGVLSGEKAGPHFGAGHEPSENSPERQEIDSLRGDFYHSDLILDRAIIEYINPDSGERKLFYPPPSDQ